MKINNLKLETSTMDLLVPVKKEISIEKSNSSNSIDLKKEKNDYYNKKILRFEELLRKEIDKLK